VEAARDPRDVRDGDEHILRLFVTARRAGDGQAVGRLWAEIVTVNFPRIQQLVYLESHGQLNPHEQEDAVALAAERIALIPRRKRGFEGTSKGEWINLVKKIVRAACIDTQRKEARHSSRQAPLYAADDGTGAAQLTQDAYKALMEQEQEREDEEQTREELKALSEKFLAWALPKLRESYRMMIECDLQGLPIEEIMDRLDRKRDSVYKLRERAMKALMKLREEYEA